MSEAELSQRRAQDLADAFGATRGPALTLSRGFVKRPAMRAT